MSFKLNVKTFVLAPLAAAVLAACSSVPTMDTPKVEVPTGFKEAAIGNGQWKLATPSEAQPRGEWWLAFHDPALSALVTQATAANQNLASAAARVRQARALAGIAEADRMPQVGGGIGAQRARASDVSLGLPQGTPVAPGNLYQAKLTASYEVDLFGRVGASVSAARLDAAASEATYRSVLLALQADVAQTYFRLRATDAELRTLEETVRLREESVKVNQRRFELGDIGEFDLARAKTELATSRAEAIGVQRQRASLEHALAVLLGRPPAAFGQESNPMADAHALPVVPAGLPSTLLERRPDISAAQQQVMASNARIGVARSALFPALTLSAAAGTETASTGALFQAASKAWVVGALLSMPLIDGGRNRANITRSEAALDESVAAYRQQVLTAFQEVEDNLAGLRILAGQAEQVDDAVVSARRSADLAQKLYNAGRSSYLELLDAQRNLAAVERSAVQLRGNRAVTTVALIRSLGGSWQ
ncbi:efflux transporter outer membrane subunit [Massilia arenosa]|uniref:Efflux transporter outer membrane subunit n=1 Tax=Zemynaea arenosa TaxID=2561931 RepID=A0A4Y9SNU5_9BURK|nr:efflux transporter outer membrane subunit [Massilia arenosa]TFW25212.1 efflux transporter outer membrane subunit [Massilia arenosa]